MPQISIIVPVYKVEPYLRRCIDSILAQTFSDFELILVDDGSPDGCGAICDEYAMRDSRICVIHQKNGGSSAARNAGLDHVFACSDSEWITFIDSDDFIDKHLLQELIDQQFATSSDLCIVTGKDGRYEKEYGPNVYSHDEILDNFYQRYSWEIWCNVMAKLYRRSLFQSVRFKIGIIYEDTQIFPFLLDNCESISIQVFDKSRYFYETHNESIMRSSFNKKKLISPFVVWWDYIQFFENIYSSAEQRDYYATVYCIEYIKTYNLIKHKEKEFSDDFQRITNEYRKNTKWLLKKCRFCNLYKITFALSVRFPAIASVIYSCWIR